MSKMEFIKVFDPAGVEMFQAFDCDCGKLYGDDSLAGVSLYEFRPVQRSGVVDNFGAMTRKELIERQEREKRQRIEQMRAVAEQAEASDTPLSDLLPPTVWNKPQPEGTPQE